LSELEWLKQPQKRIATNRKLETYGICYTVTLLIYNSSLICPMSVFFKPLTPVCLPWLKSTLLLGGAVSLLVQTMPAQAAEQLVITYGPLSAGVAVKDLQTLVETNQAPGTLKFYLNLASLDPNLLRDVLTMELGASSHFMTGMLDSNSGEQLLSKISQVVHLPPASQPMEALKTADLPLDDPSDAENMAALKTALVEAAADRRVTLLEVLQHYPTEKVYVDAVKLLEFANSLESQDLESSQPESSQSEPSQPESSQAE